MLIGAIVMVAGQIVTIEQALKSINLEVIAFLFGMFTIISGLDKAGVIRRLAIRMISLAQTPARLLMVFVVGIGGMAAFLVNDTLALLGVPLAAYVAARAGFSPTLLLLGLAFGITVGSAMTPIGNPQNLLIASQSGIAQPFLTFLSHLAVPTIVNLFLTFFILKFVYRRDLAGKRVSLSRIEMTEKIDGYYDPRLVSLTTIILCATLVGFVLSEFLAIMNIARLSLGTIAVIGAGAMYALTGHRLAILKSVNYSVLIFFAAMFVFMSGLWYSGAVSMIFGVLLPSPDPANPIQSASVISAASIGMSQVLSNVPFVTIYNFIMVDNGFTGSHVDQWMILAAASTIAGNLTILGAASNIIVIEAAEARKVPVFSYLEFFKVGSVNTAANLAVYYAFIVFL